MMHRVQLSGMKCDRVERNMGRNVLGIDRCELPENSVCDSGP